MATVTSGARLLRALPLRRDAAAPLRRVAGFELVALILFLGCDLVQGHSGRGVRCGLVLGLPPPPLDLAAVRAAWLLVMGLWLVGALALWCRRGAAIGTRWLACRTRRVGSGQCRAGAGVGSRIATSFKTRVNSCGSGGWYKIARSLNTLCRGASATMATPGWRVLMFWACPLPVGASHRPGTGLVPAREGRVLPETPYLFLVFVPYRPRCRASWMPVLA